MRSEEREDPDQDNRALSDDEVTITIMPDGTVILPQIDSPGILEIAKALGDPRAIAFCEQAALTKVHIGKRMCG